MRAVYWIVLALALLVPAAGAQADAMTFRTVTIGKTKMLLGEGEITIDTADVFHRALRRGGRGKTVILHSPGGNLMGGLLLGIAFRESGTTVAVAPGGACLSACAYAMFGGVNRKVPAGAQFGVHEFAAAGWRPGQKLSPAMKRENAEITRTLRRYAALMGVDPSVISMASRTRHDDMRYLSRRELSSLGVVTVR